VHFCLWVAPPIEDGPRSQTLAHTKDPLALLPTGPIKLASRLSRADAKPKQDSPNDGQSLTDCKRMHVCEVAVTAC